ncbi:glycoprotease family-domain-containing protein, partial [Staphylotrichum tortipilum]
MSSLQTLQPTYGNRLSARTKDDWEDWEDDEVATPTTARASPRVDPRPGEAARQPQHRPSQRASGSTARQPVRMLRLTSRRRQQAQNARAGITLVTDMTKLRQQQQIAYQMRSDARQSRTGKFVDPAALMALEGAPSDDSIGTFAWLKRKQTKGKRVERLVPDASPQADLSPSAGPITIGFAMPSDSDVVISPQTAVVETPIEFPPYFTPRTVASPSQPVSAWSPDTEDGISPRIDERAYVPAVPSIPQHYRAQDVSARGAIGRDVGGRNHRDTLTTPIYVSDEDDDMATPVTLFEEDGSPATATKQRKSLRVFQGRKRSATGGSSRSHGWWDQVTSPFGPPTPQSPGSGSGQPKSELNQWWKDENVDKKAALSTVSPQQEGESSRGPRSPPNIQHRPPEIVIEDVSSRMPSSSTAVPTASQRQAVTQTEKPRGVAEEGSQTPGELPPPYSPPSNKHNIRYHAVFPNGHPLSNMYPPSPGPVPPGLSQTMTSQGAMSLSDVPLTPAPVVTHQNAGLPDRPMGSFVPGDHFLDVSGYGPRQKAERRRRRHEKEDAAAYKAGRYWHGRGCFPCCGCFGRPGREGRKRRRVCLGACIAILVLTAVGVTLGILLSRQKPAEASVPSRFLNLTNFPPIPTGISTVIGPDSDATTGCVQPPTLWTCSLPKEEADTVAPFDASQPSFVIQIQFDNNTRQLWNYGDEDDNNKRYSDDEDDDYKRYCVGHPAPSHGQIFFLGNTTDGVVSDDKGGEPTPFYISMLRSVSDTAGPNVLTRRDDIDNGPQANITAGQGLINASDIAPPPLLNKDGTGAPAVLLGFPVQQPLRLFDRGLPTERYGFYSYFNKTTYVKSVDPLFGSGANGDASSPVPADQNGGSLRSEAKFVITWLSVRYKVEIWTRMGNTTRLRGQFAGGSADKNGTQPGTFPYPITITLDTHGGQRGKKFAFARGIDDRQRIVLNDAKFVLNRMNTTGDLFNPSGEFNPSFGGMDDQQQPVSSKTPLPPPPPPTSKRLLTLAIETSCDDTCVAVLEKHGAAARLLFNDKVVSDSREFGGIHPIAAVESHASQIAPLVERALRALPVAVEGAAAGEPGMGMVPLRQGDGGGDDARPRQRPDFISVTRGPGMTSSLAIGLTMAKGLAVAWQVPLVAVHHMQAHALTPRLASALEQPWLFPDAETNTTTKPQPQPPLDPSFPFLSLLVSGGHTQLLLSRSVISHTTLVDARGVAIGDMLDKCAREILPAEHIATAGNVMFAAQLESFAFPDTPHEKYDYTPPSRRADEIALYHPPAPSTWHLTPPLSSSRAMTYEFSGLGGQVRAITQSNPSLPTPERRLLARAAMRLAFEHLASRVIFALDQQKQARLAAKKNGKAAEPAVKTLVVAGGVASNRFLRHVLASVLRVRGYGEVRVVTPAPELCTDNAAMIAWAGMEMYQGEGWQ